MRRWVFQRNIILLLAATALWVYIGEVAIDYLYSLKWQWPELDISRETLERDFTQVDPPRSPLSQSPDSAHQYHYQRDDSHYYVVPVSSEGDGPRKGGDTGVRVLFMSDPHIMCTFQ